MNYKIISERPPVRPKIASALRSLAINKECLVFDLTQRESVASTMSRLKKLYSMEFTAQISGSQVKVWRLS